MRQLTFDPYKKCFQLHFVDRIMDIPIGTFITEDSSDKLRGEIEEISSCDGPQAIANIDKTSVIWKSLGISWERQEVMDLISRNIGKIARQNSLGSHSVGG